jgi:ComF family protein
MMKRVDAWLRRVQAALWEPRCALCGAAGQFPALDLCCGCAEDLRLNSFACVSCAEPLSGEGINPANHRLRCGLCLRRPPHFDAARCPFLYDYPLDHLIRGLKYRGRIAHGRLLGQLFAREIQLLRPAPPQLLIPVPLAQRRFRQRGYNQAIELGRSLESQLGIPLCADLMARTRETAEQAGLARVARRRNIKGAFAMLRPPQATHVAIIDDVITTGSTVNEMSRVLKRAGVKRIEVWAIARAAHAGLKTNSSAMPTNTAMPK